MNASHMLALADCLESNEETTLGFTDSRLAAVALRIVAGVVDAANDNADLRPALAACVGVSAACGA
jgi:hypothetical protein